MLKKLKLYSLNPLLAGLLLIGSLGGIYIEHEEPFTSDETKVVLPMYLENEYLDDNYYDDDNYEYRVPAPFASVLVGTEAVKKKLLGNKKIKPYELLYQHERFIFQAAEVIEEASVLNLIENELSVAENDNRLVLFTVREDFDNDHQPSQRSGRRSRLHYFTVNFDFEDLESPIWDRLMDKKDCYYRVLIDGERIVLIPLPLTGIKRSKVKANDLFALVKFDKIRDKDWSKRSQHHFEEDDDEFENQITFLLISGADIRKGKKTRKTTGSQYFPPVPGCPPNCTNPIIDGPFGWEEWEEEETTEAYPSSESQTYNYHEDPSSQTTPLPSSAPTTAAPTTTAETYPVIN
ncbi:MAG: hypothetical protein Q4P72_03105 [Eubacteriales bacterium]|nr:hypothetical protein [Eubacteriales bacterium]